MFHLKRGFETLSYAECNSLATGFINKVAVGLEIEAHIEDVQRDCSFPGDCIVCDNCPRCASCSREPGTAYPCDNCSDWNTSACESCDPCDSCYRCEDCNPCDFDSSCRGRVDVLEKIASAFGCGVGKNNTDGSPYLTHKRVANVYEDGSVNLEVVTTPQKLCDIASVHRYVCSVIKGYDAEIRPDVGNGAGGHQTVMFDHRNGSFTDTITRNVIQLSRFFAPALLWIGCVKGTEARGDYRSLNRSAVREPKQFPNGKYEFVHTRYMDGRGVYGFEFRYPDSHELSNIVQVTAVINSAIVLKAIRLSRFGVLECDQAYWDTVKENVSRFYALGFFSDKSWVCSMIDRLMKYIGQEIRDLGHPYVFKAVKTLQKYPRWANADRSTRDVKLGLAEEVVSPRSKKRKEIAEEFFVCGEHLEVPDDAVAKVLAWRMGVKERTAKKYMKMVKEVA